MSQFASLDTEGQPTRAVQQLLTRLLTSSVVKAVLAPATQRHKRVVMQTLISDRARMVELDPFAPAVFTNAGPLAAALTFKAQGLPVAALLRSCEVRALVELSKLNQADASGLLLIGVDCFGRFENQDYLGLAARHPDLSLTFLTRAASGQGSALETGIELATACQACEYPVAPLADIRLCLVGTDPRQALWWEGVSDKGCAALEAAGLTLTATEPAGRAEAVKRLETERRSFRDELFASFQAKTSSMDALLEATASCVSCFNCRVACPVCYCRQCVFCTDLFRQEGEKYLQRSRKSGSLKMPTDTLFYHLTRMAHMSAMCVGCGQCSSACPNGVAVMELFRTTAKATQERFEYLPGRSLEEKQPLATFHDDELEDTTGQRK